MKLVRVIMIKLLWNICTCVYTYGLELFVWIFTCMLSRQTLKLGYLDTTYVFSGEVETLSCYWSDAIIMKFLSEQLVLKLCQINCVMRKFETSVNEDKLYILWRTKVTNFRNVMKLSQITVLKLRAFFLKLCQNNYMQEISPIFDFLAFQSFW